MDSLMHVENSGDIGETTEVSWTPRLNLTYDQWASIGYTFQQIHRSIGWWVGDWMCFGERRFGEMAAQAVEISGASVETLLKYKAVSARIPPEERHSALSWTAHFKVTYLDPEHRRALLQMAEDYGLSTRQIDKLAKLSHEERSTLIEAMDEFGDDAYLQDFVSESENALNTSTEREEIPFSDLPYENDPEVPESIDIGEFWERLGYDLVAARVDYAAWEDIAVEACVDSVGRPYLQWRLRENE